MAITEEKNCRCEVFLFWGSDFRDTRDFISAKKVHVSRCTSLLPFLSRGPSSLSFKKCFGPRHWCFGVSFEARCYALPLISRCSVFGRSYMESKLFFICWYTMRGCFEDLQFVRIKVWLDLASKKNSEKTRYFLPRYSMLHLHATLFLLSLLEHFEYFSYWLIRYMILGPRTIKDRHGESSDHLRAVPLKDPTIRVEKHRRIYTKFCSDRSERW